MKIGISADHGGFELKKIIQDYLLTQKMEVIDFGASNLDLNDDYPDFVIPMARALAENEIERGIAICGSGVGASIVANKVKGVRAALITDNFSAHQGVEDDDLNVLCLGGRITGNAVALEIVETFLKSKFTNAERHLRRLKKVEQLENK